MLIMMAVLSAGILMCTAWSDYEEKMEILCVTLAQQDGGMAQIDIVAGLLKGQAAADVSVAHELLEQYGFHENFVNQYKKSLYHRWTVIIVVMSALSVGALSLLYWLDRRHRAVQRDALCWLQNRVTALRDSASGGFLRCAADVSGGSTTGEEVSGGELLYEYDKVSVARMLDACDMYDEYIIQFLMEFAALSDSIALFRRQADVEREGTKALVTDISHQLKTPVAALMTSFEILQSDGLSEAEYQEFLGRCKIQILRLEELVSALVNISRMETGMIELKKEERCLFDTVLLAVNRIYPKSEEKGIEIALEVAEDLKQVMVWHDAKWLCEAFLNVLENAVKYSVPQTKITITMTRLTVYLRIEIEDEGIGIPKNEWNKVFQRFYRGSAQKVQEETGSGVGLYLAREIVSRHDGTLVAAAARRGVRGSCFVFQLPYV